MDLYIKLNGEFVQLCKQGVKLLADTVYTSQHNYSMLKLSTNAIIEELDEFEPQQMDFETLGEIGSFDQMKKLLNKFNTLQEFKLVYGTDEFEFSGVMLNDSIEDINGSSIERYSFSILRTTMIYRVQSYEFDLAKEISDKVNPYDYNYDIEYSGEDNSYTASTFDIFNNGDKPAQVNVIISGYAGKPTIGVGAFASATKNSYSCTINIQIGQTIENNNIAGKASIILDDNGTKTDVAQSRIFRNSSGFLTLEQGKNTIYQTRISNASYLIYEPFYTLRGII